jgi:hypothetical protein
VVWQGQRDCQVLPALKARQVLKAIRELLVSMVLQAFKVQPVRRVMLEFQELQVQTVQLVPKDPRVTPVRLDLLVRLGRMEQLSLRRVPRRM